MSKRILITILILLNGLIVWATEDEFNTERLPIGNPKTKYDFCAIKLNRIFDATANTEISPEQLIDRLRPYQMIMLGESHTNEKHHQVQLNVIKGLVESGAAVCLALEMFTESQNQTLNDYSSGKITEDEFFDQSDYFNTWGHNYRYYKPIFDYAREKKIKMFGVNVKQDYTSKIGRGGISALSPEEQSSIPKIDTTDAEHRFYIKTAMEGMDATSPAQFSNIYAAQCLWDAAMGEGAIKIAREFPESKVIILTGSGHVAYNLGIGKIIQMRSELTFVSVLAIDVPDTLKESAMMKVKKNLEKDKKKEPVTDPQKEKKMPPMPMMPGTGSMEDLPHKIIVRSLADFFWGVPEEKQEKYPSFGLSINEKKDRGFEVKRVLPESIIEEQGFQKGDIILAIDNQTFANMNQLKKYLSFKNWNEEIIFKFLREGKEVEKRFLIESKE